MAQRGVAVGFQRNSARDGRVNSNPRAHLDAYILKYWVQCSLVIDTAVLVARVSGSPNLI